MELNTSNVIELNPERREPKPVDTRTPLERLVDSFLQDGKKRSEGRFYIDGNRLMHRTFVDNRERVTTIAVKMQGGCTIGNSSTLEYVGGHSAWGSYKRNRSQHLVQAVLEKKVPMVPLVAFEQSGLPLSSLKVVHQTGAETVKRKVRNPDYRYGGDRPEFITESAHFTGASLFELEGKHFLFDVDRRELEHRIFNPFMAEVPGKPKTVAEAYELLKPKAVKDAEKKRLNVLRQGEWFFIPCAAPKLKDQARLKAKVAKLASEIDKLSWGGSDWEKRQKLQAKLAKVRERVPSSMELRAGPNRPNDVTLAVKVGKDTFVSGKVSHRGREHADLDLGKKWYRPVPNTAVKSFTITGDVD